MDNKNKLQEVRKWFENHSGDVEINNGYVSLCRKEVFDDVQQKCEWTEDSDGTWNTDCGNSFVLNEGKPDDKNMNFCLFCGGVLVQNEFDDKSKSCRRLTAASIGNSTY